MERDCTGSALDQFTKAQKPKVISIYRTPKDGPASAVEHCGTGILFFHANRHFLLSAAHLFDNTDRFDLGAYRKSDGRLDSRVFRGRKFTSEMPVTGRDDDMIDIGVMPLNDDEVEFFGRDGFYTINDCVLSHRCKTSSLYTAYGFPNTKNEPNFHKNRLRVQPVSYSRHGATQDRFQRLQLSPATHVILDLNPRMVSLSTGGTQSPPARRGMSGGPVFHYHDYAGADANFLVRNPKLAAVLIENPGFDRSTVLVGTSITYAVEAMERAAKELDGNVPDTELARDGS